jgi:hypothetical protein
MIRIPTRSSPGVECGIPGVGWCKPFRILVEVEGGRGYKGSGDPVIGASVDRKPFYFLRAFAVKIYATAAAVLRDAFCHSSRPAMHIARKNA